MKTDPAQLLETLGRLGKPSLVVLGDLILDRYTWGQAARISPEAPVVVLRSDKQEERLGGAANVAHMLAALGAEVRSVGVVGSEAAGGRVRQLLAEVGIDTSAVLTDSTRPTSVKERFMGRAGSCHAHQMLRVDCESTQPLSAELESELRKRLTGHLQSASALLIADYAKGVCTPELLRWVIAEARRLGCPILVDPGQGRDLEYYRGATLMKPNRRETELATRQIIDSGQAAEQAGIALCRQYGFDLACITLDADGMMLCGPDGSAQRFPTQARAVYDITGAGDMVLAMLGFCVAQEVPLKHSVQLANIAAGLEVEQNGVVPISLDEIRQQLHASLLQNPPKQIDLVQAHQLAELYRQQQRRIVFTNGCFDLLHVGHVTYLQEAAAMGDVLIVGVNGDASVRRLKGPQRPVISENDRAAMLAALACVNHVIVFDTDTPHPLLHAIRPDVLVKGGTYRPDEVVGHEFVSSYGGQVAVTSMIDGVSTTRIVESMRERKSDQPVVVPLARRRAG